LPPQSHTTSLDEFVDALGFLAGIGIAIQLRMSCYINKNAKMRPSNRWQLNVGISFA